MKRIGLVILSLVLAVNLCMGFGGALADNADDTVYKTSADGQFKYHIVDWLGDGAYVYAILDEYLGAKSTLDLPEKVDGYKCMYDSEKFFRSMKTVTTVVFQKPSESAAFAVYAPKLQSIQVVDFGNTDCFIYDGCLYGPYYFDSIDKSTVISECMMWGAPGGKETINLYKNVDKFTSNENSAVYLENMQNLKKINVPEENKKYKSVDGIVLSKEGEVDAIPQKYCAGKNLELPFGVTKSNGHSYTNWEKVVFPEGMQEYTAAESTYWYGDLKEPTKKFSHDELVGVLSSDGPKTLVFPSTLTTFGYETRNAIFSSGSIDNDDYGSRYMSTRIEKSVKDIYLNMTRESAQKNIQLKDRYSDDEYKINTLDEFFAFYYPNATIHYNKTEEQTTPSETVKPSESPKPSETVKPSESPNQVVAYSDVPTSGKWYSNAVYYATDKGYMAGTGNNKFSPDATVTRGTIAQILYAAEGKPAVSGKSQFTDVGESKWYAKAVKWAADKGLVSGYGNGKFGPEDRITREQMVAIMMQYSKMKGYDTSANAELSKFRDQSTISKWAVNAVKWGVSHKIVSGTDKGIEPKGNATRAQIAVILQAYDKNVRK